MWFPLGASMASNTRSAANGVEIDAAVSKLTTYRNVLGYLVLSRPRKPEDQTALIRLGGPDFEGALNPPSTEGDMEEDDPSPIALQTGGGVPTSTQPSSAGPIAAPKHAASSAPAPPSASGMAPSAQSKKRDQVKAVINLVSQTLGSVSDAAQELDKGDLRFLRIRTAHREVLIAPSPDFVLAVVQVSVFPVSALNISRNPPSITMHQGQ